MNPTEKGFSSHLPLATDPAEPAWLRDTTAWELQLDLRQPEQIPQILAAICEGEKSFCEHCGADFPMWPTKVWADHLLMAHGTNLTIQARTGTAAMCEDQIGPAQQVFFSMMLGSRVSMRRRAWKLGYAVVREAEGRVRLSN
jgi:hypothetical protein